MRAAFASVIAVLAAAALLSACGGDRPAAAPPPPAKKAAPKETAAAPATPAAPAYVYSYNPVAKRDPFRSPVEEIRAPGNTPGEVVCTDPLCQYDLDQLTLVAVVTGDANPIAMVEDPQGRGFIVRRSSKMGKQGGKVTNILSDSVVITEYFVTPDGKPNANPRKMQLKSDKQAKPVMDLATGQLVTQ